MLHIQKRQHETTQFAAEPTALPKTKRQKREHQQLDESPNFWDELTRVPLCPRALREFDRRTIRPVHSGPPDLSKAEQSDPNQVKFLAENGGPSLENLRSYPSACEADTAETSSRSTMGKSVSAYSPGFQQHLQLNGFYLPNHESAAIAKKPSNLQAIKSRLAMVRPSVIPSLLQENSSLEHARLKFIDNNEISHASEDQLKLLLLPILSGQNAMDIPFRNNILLNNLTSLTPSLAANKSLSRVQPDWYDGSPPLALKDVVRNDLSKQIVPSTETTHPCLPNFFMEMKKAGGDTVCCRRQAWHDAALGARGIHNLRSYGDAGNLDDGKAYTITATFEPGPANLTIYAVHPTVSNNPDHSALLLDPARHYEYWMTEVASYRMVSDDDVFQKGVTAFRNARDWAQEQRNQLIQAANSKADTVRPSELMPST